MEIGIGIDTGGTYTDAVVYDFEKNVILGSAKALTTRFDLSVGIMEALDGLPKDLVQAASLVSLSTTLATNACVEDKGGNARLVFIGADRKNIDESGKEYGLPPSREIYFPKNLESSTSLMHPEPDWELFDHEITEAFGNLDGVGIIETFAQWNAASVEKEAKRRIEKKLDIPVVCSHELFSELNCFRRGTSTLLNAQLFPVIKEFMKAIKTAMKLRKLNAPVVIVRSDGSLMSESFTHERPVETLLCGPAASVIGAAGLGHEENCMILDMGGTTTDIAVMRDGIPVQATDGIQVGRWKTHVKGLYIHTFGLGGDSAVHYKEGELVLEEYRVVPLCVVCAEYPSILENLQNLVDSKRLHSQFLHEHLLLMRDITQSDRYTKKEKALCQVLQKGPLILQDAAEAIGESIYSLDISRLLKEGIIHRCGLTPTDIMHIRGDFTRFDKEASLLGAQYVAENLEITIDELCTQVYDEVKRKMYINVVKAMLENKSNYYSKNGISEDIENMIRESYQAAKNGDQHDLLSMRAITDYTLVGIGAPIHIFLKDVAALLGTKAVIPDHAEVANALGSIMGKIHATCTVEIRPIYSPGGIIGFTIFGDDPDLVFETLEEAEVFAKEKAEKTALDEAKKRGATGEISVSCTMSSQEGTGKDDNILLGTAAVARAVGAFMHKG